MGILSKEEKDSQVIAAMICREMITLLMGLLRHNNVDEKIISCLNDSLSTSNLFIYKAQHYDLNLLSLSNTKQSAMYLVDRKKFLHDYNIRCYYGSGIFSSQVAMAGAIAANANDEYCQALKNFGSIYGTALHKINDL